MKKILWIFLLFITFGNIHAQRINQEIQKSGNELFLVYNGVKYSVNTKVINVKPKYDIENLKTEVKPIYYGEFGYVDIEVPEKTDIQEYVKMLKESGDFDVVEYIGETKCYSLPNDSLLQDQDHISCVSFDRAWDVTTGSSNIKVGVIDTGIWRDHPDIGYGNDGYTNISYSLGYDYFAGTTYQTPTEYHGTEVAGVIGAKRHNTIGVAGIAGGNNSAGVTLISYHAIDTSPGSNSSSYVGDAIKKAVDQGAKVINISAGPSYLTKTEEAINYAYNHNVTIVCAAGNEGNSYLSYPASNSKTIAVGGSTSDGEWKSGLNYGTGLDIIAPAMLTGTTTINPLSGHYTTIFGFTSSAAAIVSGTVSLMLSVNPSLTPTQIRSILRSTATKPSGYSYNSEGWEAHVGYGVVDPFEALLVASNTNFSDPAVICDGTNMTLSLNGIPSDMYVSWRYEGDDNTSLPPFNMYASGNSACNVSCYNTTSFFGYIIAEVRYGGTCYATFKKRVRGVSPLSGTFHQTGGYYHGRTYPTFTKSLTSSIVVNQECSITLQSAKFKNMHISISPTSNCSSWSFDGDQTLTFVPTYGTSNKQFVISGTSSSGGTCNNFSINVTSTNVPIPSIESVISIGLQGKIVNVEIVQLDTEEGHLSSEQEMSSTNKIQTWTLEVYNVTTGEKIYEQKVTGSSFAFDTTGWKPGIYIVRAVIGDKELNEKIVVK